MFVPTTVGIPLTTPLDNDRPVGRLLLAVIDHVIVPILDVAEGVKDTLVPLTTSLIV